MCADCGRRFFLFPYVPVLRPVRVLYFILYNIWQDAGIRIPAGDFYPFHNEIVHCITQYNEPCRTATDTGSDPDPAVLAVW